MLTDQANNGFAAEKFSKDENLDDLKLNSKTSSVCSSAKQHRKMQTEKHEDIKFTYSWTQTDACVAVHIKIQGLSDEQTCAFDVSFTSKEVTVKAAEKTHVIHFYGSIQKEESRVQAAKGSIVLQVVKQQAGLWPELEANKGSSVSCDGSAKSNKELVNNFGNRSSIENSVNCDIAKNGNKLCDGSTKCDSSPLQDSLDVITRQDITVDIKEKEEEPVFRLSHLKHDFYERGHILTLSVFTKSLNKDAVKVNFSSHGFILKFQTSDAKFLQLHKGTSSETAFTWPVTTRQEIVPEECKCTVKTSVIEIVLKKTSADRWASLEAPLRKEKPESSQSDTWIPMNTGSSATVLTSSAPPLSSSAESTADILPAEATSKKEAVKAEGNKKPSVMFDDLAEVSVNVKGQQRRNASSSSIFRDHQEEEEEEEDGCSGFSFDNAQKPTAKVSPLNSQMSETAMVIPPGFAGLVNIGNTCFMNCVIQVLANTREFRDFFLDGRFQLDINEDNPLGMKGQLAASFGVLLRWLWSCKKHYWDPRRLKDLISKKNPQFFGYAQHDAHEFLAFLLDGLHEDLNRIRKKPYTETIDSDGRPDKVVAEEAWAQYKLRNDSVVVDLFQGQFKSKLVCPRCGKVSITFDPFLYMSVPMPKKKKVIPVHFIWKESYKKPVKYLIQVSQDSSVERLKEELYTRTRVRPCDIRVFEAYRGRILKFFLSGASLANVEPKDIIVACELLSEEVAGEDVLEIPVMQRTLFPAEYPRHCAFCRKPCMEGAPLRRCTKCYKVGYCDRTCQRNHWNSHKSVCSTTPDPIGCPFIMSVPASRATYSYLVKHMEEFARFSVDIFQPPVRSSSSSSSLSTTPSATPDVLLPSGVASSPAAGVKPHPTSLAATPTTNLSSCSLSQSCSSLNSLDSLSSASSTCTLTGDTSDTQTTAGEGSGAAAAMEDETSRPPRHASPPQAGCDTDGANRSASVDSGFESLGSKSFHQPTGDKTLPMSSVLGVQTTESERDKAIPTFYISPVSMEGVALRGADKMEDKGETPLEIMSGRFLSMDWRNNERLPSYVLVQSKDLDAQEVDNMNNLDALGNKFSLYNCLEMFTEPEVLSPEEAWYCPSCKKHVEASKQMSIWRLPHTLVIQLKRFSFQNFLMRSKIKKHIDFPTRGLDLRRFCVGLRPGDSPPIYDLYAVANHHGLLIGGHYTAYVRCSSLDADVGGGDEIGWRLCNDSRVTSVTCDKSVVTADAYLLFYRRRCPATISPSSSASTVASPELSRSSQYIEALHPMGKSVSAGLAKERSRTERLDDDDKDDDDDGHNSLVKAGATSVSTGTRPQSNEDLTNFLSGQAGVEYDTADSQGQQLSSTLDDMYSDVDLAGCRSSAMRRVTNSESSGTEECVGEKKDEEKEFLGSDKERRHEEDLYLGLEDEEDDDEEEKERGLVIVTEPDLGYTDMEAVD